MIIIIIIIIIIVVILLIWFFFWRDKLVHFLIHFRGRGERERGGVKFVCLVEIYRWLIFLPATRNPRGRISPPASHLPSWILLEFLAGVIRGSHWQFLWAVCVWLCVAVCGCVCKTTRVCVNAHQFAVVLLWWNSILIFWQLKRTDNARAGFTYWNFIYCYTFF